MDHLINTSRYIHGVPLLVYTKKSLEGKFGIYRRVGRNSAVLGRGISDHPEALAREMGPNLASMGPQQFKPIHLGVGARDFGLLAILTWIAAALFAIAMISGSYGLLFTTTPSKRRRWIGFHRNLTNLLYLAILPHILIKGTGSIMTAGVLITAVFLVWKFNPTIVIRLKTISWPLRKANRSNG